MEKNYVMLKTEYGIKGINLEKVLEFEIRSLENGDLRIVLLNKRRNFLLLFFYNNKYFKWDYLIKSNYLLNQRLFFAFSFLKCIM